VISRDPGLPDRGGKENAKGILFGITVPVIPNFIKGTLLGE